MPFDIKDGIGLGVASFITPDASIGIVEIPYFPAPIRSTEHSTSLHAL
jgi:hypothetical protein